MTFVSAAHDDHDRSASPAPTERAHASDPLRQVIGLIDALHCGGLLNDRRGTIVHLNQRLADMLQRDRSDLVGRTLFDIYPSGEGREIIEQALRHFDESREREFFLPRPDGSRLEVIVSGRRLEGEPPLSDHRIVTVIDISQQKAAERELQERYHDITSLSDTVLEQSLALKHHTTELEQRVRERTLELHEANMEAIYMLAVASEAKDADTGAHVRRIEHLSRLLAREMGLTPRESERIAYSAILHDVGKMHVPDEILRKPAGLTDEQWTVMRQHTTAGERILSRAPFFEVARNIARSHHENWDGSGYPDGLNGSGIPLAARIVHVADVYDALVSPRVYKKAWDPRDAVKEIEKEQERMFDPVVVRSFVRLWQDGKLRPMRDANVDARMS